MREDYEKFRKVFESQDTGNLYLASPDGDYEWHEKVYPRLYYLGTEMELGYWNDCFELSGDKFGKAINLDIFLFDYVDNDPAKIEDTIKGFQAILGGDVDDLPEQAFLLCGTIDEVIAKRGEY
jgi:hypothetical protein